MPLSFLEGLRALQLNDFSEIEIACLMNILAKPQLENAILVDELVSIMENFGIVEGQMTGEPIEGSIHQEPSLSTPGPDAATPPDGGVE